MSDRILAIAVALLIPDAVSAAASTLNAQLSPTLKFDSSHLPHITVLQQFLGEGNVGRAQDTLATIAASLEPIPIRVTGIGAQPFDGTNVIYWEIERSEALIVLHNKVSAAFAPLACGGTGESFFGAEHQPVRASTVRYVADFRRTSSDENFAPHLTLGFGERNLRQDLLSFTATRVAVCHLGDLNACRRVLFERWI
jgi:2'-5' RNA ligase